MSSRKKQEIHMINLSCPIEPDGYQIYDTEINSEINDEELTRVISFRGSAIYFDYNYGEVNTYRRFDCETSEFNVSYGYRSFSNLDCWKEEFTPRINVTCGPWPFNASFEMKENMSEKVLTRKIKNAVHTSDYLNYTRAKKKEQGIEPGCALPERQDCLEIEFNCQTQDRKIVCKTKRQGTGLSCNYI